MKRLNSWLSYVSLCFITFPSGVLDQVCYLIFLIPDICLLFLILCVGLCISSSVLCSFPLECGIS